MSNPLEENKLHIYSIEIFYLMPFKNEEIRDDIML